MRPSRIISLLILVLTSVSLLAQDSIAHAPSLVRRANRVYTPGLALDGCHIAMWPSHGLYYELANARWEWQRARMFETVEDKFTISYATHYLTPMLENAGAVVLMPRERDFNSYEIVADNDGELSSGIYRETVGSNEWQTGEGHAFAYTRRQYKDSENPFREGTYRQVTCTSDDQQASEAAWIARMPESGRCAVYVSYRSLDNSATDARYTIYHRGGATTVLVNQAMGGGTWIYLGNYQFGKGDDAKVVLSNVSAQEGAVVTADAVRFGGGMGNVARYADGKRIYDNTKLKKGKASSTQRNEWQLSADIEPQVSGYPRFMEAARYYLQWAGVPDSIYSPSHGTNDYTDDYRCRGAWVNYVAGGSVKRPGKKGLGIPLDLSLAFHTDGGTVTGDRTIGTLGIYTTASNRGRLADGSSRAACRDLCSSVYNSILNDIRKLVEPSWNGRGIQDKNYSETSSPEVPAMILELLSHESFGEMRYGLDPRFQFIASRAIYKGILKFLSKRNGTEYIVQPLPVSKMAIALEDNDKVRLSWQSVVDSLEETARADSFIVYKRIGSRDFDHGTLVADTFFTTAIPADEVVSFKVTAVNRGGESLPSETLSAGVSSRAGEKRPVLVVNGFDRVSAPDDFVSGDDKMAGFLADQDNGVPYGIRTEYVGRMKEYRRSIKMDDDDKPGFGACYGNEEKKVIAGNTFDYPALHGEALLSAGYSFTSVSRAACDSLVGMAADSLHTLNNTYGAIDLILGKQKQCKMGRLREGHLAFKTFDDTMQKLLTAYCKNGGSVFVSGSYVGVDLWQNPQVKATAEDKTFAKKILKYQWRDEKACADGHVKYVASPFSGEAMLFDYHNTANAESYVVESPDAIIPAESAAFTVMRYDDSAQSAAVAFKGNATDKWRTFVMGFPFEAIKDYKVRNNLMQQVMRFLGE